MVTQALRKSKPSIRLSATFIEPAGNMSKRINEELRVHPLLKYTDGKSYRAAEPMKHFLPIAPVCLSLLVSASCTSQQDVNSEWHALNQQALVEKLEFSYLNDQNVVFTDLMDFLKPKWNLDNDYAAQVLGFLAGYLPNHRDARKYYKSIRKEIKNARLVRLLDDISDGDFSSTASYLDERRLNLFGYFWFVCFADFSETTVDILLDRYCLVDESDFSARMEIRYFYERHDLVKKAVDKRNGTLSQMVREKSYEELEQELWNMILDMKKSN